MSPRDLDPDVIQARLHLLDGLLEDLANVGELTAADLEADRMLRHAIERILSQVVDLAVSINSHIAATELGRAPGDYRSSFGLLREAGVIDGGLTDRLVPSVGLRNVLAHEYVDIDLAVVAAASGQARKDYGDYVRAVAQWLGER